MPTVTRLLVANRAEIASRVFRTCRRLGIACVAVHSDADAGLPYVAEADQAVRLPGDSPAETYLRVDLVLAAARRAGADAVHPGYGFLSESAAFARAVVDAGLVWVGPDPASIEAMGSKIRAKELMAAAGVPVLSAPAEPTEADLPLLVKASAGGGGRGMRVVRRIEDLAAEVATAEAEAASAFGDGTVFVEPYVERGRHVEVQVLGDGHGRAVAVGERDCSVQRRHQKVVEESPAPALAPGVARAMHDAARAAAEAISYRGAGTVEFLHDPSTDRFWFLEMNTRLQVEHPVTELVHGLDLVEEQLRIAEAGASPAELPEVGEPRGHAIEVRLYAEDPAADHQPQSGRLTAFEIPLEPGVRIDAGFESGSVVSTHYDAMLAKVVVHAPTRSGAARRLAGVLGRARIHGLRTNRDQLVAVLRDEAFLDGRVSTAFLADRRFDRPAADPRAPLAAALALAERAREARTVQHRVPVAWRNVVSQPQVTWLEDGVDADAPLEVRWWGGRDGYRVEGATVVAASPTSVTLEADGVRTTYAVRVDGLAVDVDSPTGHVALRRVPRFTDPAEVVAAGSLLAPMPGTVVKVLAEVGEAVAAGQPVLVLEAMKMQHTVSAPAAGTLTRLEAAPGGQVAAGEVLAVVGSDEGGGS